MKTTLELPGDLMRRVKMRAAQDNRKLKDVVSELLERGLAGTTRSPAPTPKPPRPAVLRKRKQQTIDDIEAAIKDGRA